MRLKIRYLVSYVVRWCLRRKFKCAVLLVVLILFIAHSSSEFMSSVASRIVITYNKWQTFYPACHVTSNRVQLDHLDCPLSLDEISHLTKGANEDVLVMTYTNGAWLDMLKNWICFLQNLNLNMLIIALDPSLCAKLKDLEILNPGIFCKPLDKSMVLKGVKLEEKSSNITDIIWASERYMTMMKQKIPALFSTLLCNHPVLLIDTDVALLRNPLPLLTTMVGPKPTPDPRNSLTNDQNKDRLVSNFIQSKHFKDFGCGTDDTCPYDIIFAKDSTNWRMLDYLQFDDWLGRGYVCAGFMLTRPTRASFAILETIMNYQKTSWNDQEGFNICLHHWSVDLHWTSLDANQFPNGLILNTTSYEVLYKSKTIEPYMLHFNWARGNKDKQNLMKKYNVWTDRQKGKGLTCT